MNSRIGVGDCWTASITFFRRCSNSPFTPAPACSRPRSSVRTLTSRMTAGTSPSAIFSARPSTSAVLPTPGSPTRIGLFLRRRARISTICRISTSRPNTGSILPSRAWWVMSMVKRLSASDAGCASPFARLALADGSRFGSPGATCSPERAVVRSCASTSTLGASTEVRLSSGARRSIWVADTESKAHASGARSRCGASVSAASRCAERIEGDPSSSEARIHAASISCPSRWDSPGFPRSSCGSRSIAPSRPFQMLSTLSS